MRLLARTNLGYSRARANRGETIMSSGNQNTVALSEGEIQILASLARAESDGSGLDRASLETSLERFGPFRADPAGAVDLLRSKGLMTGDDAALQLTEAGRPLARAYHAERPNHDWYYFRKFYAAADASAAHSELCERAYGRDLCQEGMVDMEALDDLLDRLDLKPGDTLLDLGCGAGGIAEYISDWTGARVTGIDISTSAIEVAQARTAAKRDRLDFVIGDLNALDLKPNSFDAAIAVDALYWVADLDRTLDDILASLRPGGKLAVHTLHGREADEPLEAMEAQASPIAKALDRRGLSYEVSEHTANIAAFWQRNYKAAVDLRDSFMAEGNVWIADSLIREAEEEFLPAFEAGLMARYLFHVRL